MKLYYAAFSPPARAVLMTIRHLNLDVEVININFQKGENKSEEFTALNPLQQVPVLVEDDGFVLTESRAIMAYLVASRDTNSALYPLSDAVMRALVDERLYFDATTVFFSHIQILHPMVANGDPKVPEPKKEIMRNVLSTLDRFVSDKEWIAGAVPTIADFSILSNIIVILSAGIRINKYTNLSAWYERCKTLKGFTENYNGGKTVASFLKMRGLPPVTVE